MIVAILIVVFFIGIGVILGITEPETRENKNVMVIPSYRLKRRGGWRIFNDKILDENGFRKMVKEEQKIKIR